MKNLALLFLLSYVLFACNQNKTVTISGKITNPLKENVTVEIIYTEVTDTIVLNSEDGTFSKEIALEKEHFATFKNGNFAIPLNLVPGANIHIEFDVEDFKNGGSKNIQITGEESETTAFMFLLKDKGTKKNTPNLAKMRVDSFKIEMDESIKTIAEEIEKFESENSPSPEFIENIKLIHKISHAQKYNYFVLYHARYAPNDTIPIPDSFQAYFDEIPTDNYEKSKEIEKYKFFVVNHIQKTIHNKLTTDGLKKKTPEYTNQKINKIAALETPQNIKDELAYRMILSYSFTPAKVQEVVKVRYKEILQNQEYIDKFEKTIANIEKLVAGSVAPTFSYPDINGEIVSSESLKGKVIYIDVWATWCSPCKKEIPHLKKMEKALHNEPIAFVSISIDSDKADWEKMVKEKELGGYQLFAKEAWGSEIMTDYTIRGVPRFIIIDKEGKLVEANATRPSDAKTKEKLLELAKKIN